MAGTISFLPGATAEGLPSPVGASPKRSVAQRGEYPSAPVRPLPEQPAEGLPEQPAETNIYPAAILERAQAAGLARRTTLIFERDVENGKMYVHIRDKSTGEEVTRIPNKILENASPQPEPDHQVDVRI